MSRSEKKARRLVVDGNVYLWTLGHTHHALGDGRYEDCCEVLAVRRFRASGRLRVLFREGPGRFVPDGHLHSGAVGTEGGGFLNLHEPGTARALLDAALAQGWAPDDPAVRELDGWTLFEAVATRRRA
ncbi:hypothetical protein [Streptomyces sp. MZ04]|uniref:hypothetical protein n=1 Tax=Streptomyces sp. MZ04 TaxID=2559236 RepID=UPI00107EA7ED|nr:hypothetical protein [Streptomyces sp. MZ04]TGB14727.1 hypothetical protein E2651_04965 [Streptomyces sp. MZ04]